MVASGIIDPAKVTRSALENAASIAGMILTTETLIVDEPEEEKPMPCRGGMGGMGCNQEAWRVAAPPPFLAV